MKFILLFLIIAVRTATDISFKKAVHDMEFTCINSTISNLTNALLCPYYWLGIIFGIANVLVWTVSLEYFDLSFAYPFLSISFITIILCGKLFFNEHLDAYKLTGISFITVGSMILFLG